MANGGLLGAIINPAQADVLGALDKGRERQATDLAGELLGQTVTGKIGDLARLSPDKFLAFAEATNTPITSEGRVKNLLGINIAGAKLLTAGMTQEAIQFLDEEATKIEASTQQPATKLRAVIDAIQTGDQETVNNFIASGQKLDPTLGGPSALDQAKTAEVVAKTKKLGIETELLDKSNPTDQLKIQELQLKIENQQAVVEDRKQKAIAASSQRDSTAVASAFEAQGAIANIDDLLLDDAFEDIYGVGDKFIPTIFSGAVALEAKRDQIVALLGLESRQKLKGQGTISDSEARSLADSATLLGNPGIDEVTAKKELKKVRLIFQRAQARAMKNPEAKIQIGIAAKKARLEELREKAGR